MSQKHRHGQHEHQSRCRHRDQQYREVPQCSPRRYRPLLLAEQKCGLLDRQQGRCQLLRCLCLCLCLCLCQKRSSFLLSLLLLCTVLTNGLIPLWVLGFLDYNSSRSRTRVRGLFDDSLALVTLRKACLASERRFTTWRRHVTDNEKLLTHGPEVRYEPVEHHPQREGETRERKY